MPPKAAGEASPLPNPLPLLTEGQEREGVPPKAAGEG